MTTPATVHHRWFKFLPEGQKRGVRITVTDGQVQLPLETVVALLVDAGYEQHDPDPVERAWLARKEAARSELQDALNRRAR